MTEKLQIYKCEHCGTIVEVLHSGKGHLTCCKTEMKLFTENTTDAAKEKHIPVIEYTAEGILVKVGSVEHPMSEEHYIEWIELIIGKKVCRHFLNPEDKPEVLFKTEAKEVSVRAYCNLHGLWRA